MPVPVAAISAGLGIAKHLFGGGGRKRPNISKAIAQLRGSKPTGYITPEDLLAADRTRGRLNENVQAAGRLEGHEVARRFRARGLAGSPAEERARARLEQQTLLGTQHAGEAGEEQLYNMRTGREAYQHQNDLAIFGAEVGDVQREQDRMDAQNGAFWNSLNEFVTPILGSLGTGEEGGYRANSATPGIGTAEGSGPVGPAYGPPRGYQPEMRPAL